MTIIIQALDSEGNRWFRNTHHQWQAIRGTNCHFPNAIEAGKIYHEAVIANRFADPDARMEEIELVELK